MAELPKTMKAWAYDRRGKLNDVLEFKPNVLLPPAPKAGEVMINVSYPATPGIDFVGEIVQVGAELSGPPSKVRMGMTVGGSVLTRSIFRGAGTLAEYIVLPAHAVVEKPKDLPESVAAGLLGVAGQTCAMLLKSTKFFHGHRVLVNGASGGVGCVLIQVLHGMGIHVTAICSARNEAFVRRLGAEEVIDYTAHKDLYAFLIQRRSEPGGDPFNTIIDCVGDMTLYDRSAGYLEVGGVFCTIENPFLKSLIPSWWPRFLGGTGWDYKGVMNDPSGVNAGIAANWVEKGWIKEIPVDSTFSMEEGLKAFEKQATGRASGKIFVKVKQ